MLLIGRSLDVTRGLNVETQLSWKQAEASELGGPTTWYSCHLAIRSEAHGWAAVESQVLHKPLANQDSLNDHVGVQ